MSTAIAHISAPIPPWWTKFANANDVIVRESGKTSWNESLARLLVEWN